MEHREMTETRIKQLYSGRVAGHGRSQACVTPEAILAVVQREGSEDERLATLEHVMSCADCHREYEWLMAVNEAGLEAEGTTSAGRQQAWWNSRPLALAASIAVVLGATVVLARMRNSGAERERGNTSDIALLAPGTRATRGASLSFSWRALPGASRYVLEVQRPDGSIAYADTTSDTLVVVAQSSTLLPDSAYRWWVREVTDGTEPRSSAFRDLRLTIH